MSNSWWDHPLLTDIERAELKALEAAIEHTRKRNEDDLSWRNKSEDFRNGMKEAYFGLNHLLGVTADAYRARARRRAE